MLRPLSILTFAALAVLLCSTGCKKSHTAQAPGYPDASAAGTPAIPVDETTEKKFDKALQKAGVTDTQRDALLAEFGKQGPKYGYKLSDDKQFLVQDGVPGQGTPIQVALVEASNLKDAQPDAAGQVKMYFERRQQQVEVAKKAADEQTAALQRIDKGEITAGLYPAADPTGDWQSIGETREGEKHFLVEHDDKYYKMLRMNKDAKTLQIQEVKEGKVERDTTLPYKYDAEKGQLTTTGAGGGPGDAFIVMELQNIPDRIFVRPMYDTVFAYTVYRRVGRNPNMGGPMPRMVGKGPAPGK